MTTGLSHRILAVKSLRFTLFCCNLILIVHTFLHGLPFSKSLTWVSHPRDHCEKDTWRSLCPADQVEACGYDVCHLSPSCQVLAHHHLEEIKGRV